MLVLNLGSSSLKFSLVNRLTLEPQYKGSVKNMYSPQTLIEITNGENLGLVNKIFDGHELESCIAEIVNWIDKSLDRTKIIALGYRVVQGGPGHIMPQAVDANLLEDLETYIYLAPNHLPKEIKLMKAFGIEFQTIPHIACFDTFFHRDMPGVAKFYALPSKYRDMGLQRYGFHGLSCESIIQQLLEEDDDVANQKIIIVHLGSGCSITAIDKGRSRDTTMGISPIGGLVMATRSGDLDPGAILFMLKQEEISVDQLDFLLSTQSGLKAIAGVGDMKQIIAARDSRIESGEALEIFCYQAKKHMGALAAAIGGIDLLVFCGGIGENAALVREKICADMEFMGIGLNCVANHSNEKNISSFGNKVYIRIMETDEQDIIARHMQNILANNTYLS